MRRSRTSRCLALSTFGSGLCSFYRGIQIILQNPESAWLMFNVVVIELFTVPLIDVNMRLSCKQKIRGTPESPTFVHLSPVCVVRIIRILST